MLTPTIYNLHFHQASDSQVLRHTLQQKVVRIPQDSCQQLCLVLVQSLVLDQLIQINKAFQFADSNNKGGLNKQDYKVAILALTGAKPDKEVRKMFGANENCESSSLISLEQFSNMTKNLWRNRDGNKHIWDMFQALDPTDKVFLVLEDLEQARKQVVPHLQEWRLREAFRQTDKDADKRVGFREFREFVTQNMENNLFLRDRW